MKSIFRVQKECRDYILEYCGRVRQLSGDRFVSFVPACCRQALRLGGSWEARRGSNVNILLVIEDLSERTPKFPSELTQIYIEIQDIENYQRLRQKGYNPLIMRFEFTPAEIKRHPPILRDIINEEIIIFDRNRFFEKALKNLKRKLRKLGAKKVYPSEDALYWILKPDVKFGERVEI